MKYHDSVTGVSELSGLWGVTLASSQKEKKMFARYLTPVVLAFVAVTPAFAAFETGTEFGSEIGDYFVTDILPLDGGVCSHPLDLLDNKDDLAKSADESKSLLTTLTGITPTHFPEASLPLVACN